MKKILSLAVLLFSFSSAWSLDVRDIVPREYIDELLEKRLVYVVHEESDDSLSLVPESNFKSMLHSRRIVKKDSPYTAEFLYYISKKDLKALGSKNKDDIGIPDISEVFTSISNMSGMRYRFSEKNMKGSVLYRRVYTISDLKSARRIGDFTTRNCDGLNSFCYQHDRLLGNLKFFLEYHQKGDELYLSILNEVPLGLFGIHACKSEDLRINIHVSDCGDDILFYISADANYDNILKKFSIRNFIERLMIERLGAIYTWFFVQF